MKGQNAARIAAGLAAEVEAALVRAGSVAPPREDLTAALWPAALVLAAKAKAARRAEREHRQALDEVAAAEVQCQAAMGAVAGRWVAEHPPQLWRLALQLAPDAPGIEAGQQEAAQ